MNVVTHERKRAEGRRGIYEDLVDSMSEFCGFRFEGRFDLGALREMGCRAAFECATVTGVRGYAVGEEEVEYWTWGGRRNEN